MSLSCRGGGHGESPRTCRLWLAHPWTALALSQIPTVMRLCEPQVPHPLAEAALRALVSVSYPDRISIPLVVMNEGLIPMLVEQIRSTAIEVSCNFVFIAWLVRGSHVQSYAGAIFDVATRTTW